MTDLKNILVTGGAGYVGSVLVPQMIRVGYNVTVLDLYLYGEDVLSEVKGNSNLKEIKGDIRDQSVLKKALEGQDAVIHLACISNDPSYELNPDLGKSINYDAFVRLVPMAKEAGVKRFIYASSSSVYGIKEEENVTENLPLQPLTDYSKFKALCEEELLKYKSDDFCVLILRPATVCGYAPRLRLDLTVNILTNHAVQNKKIKVFGGNQRRPNIHIKDICDLYIKSLNYPSDKINGKIFNAGYENHKVTEIADMVRNIIDPEGILIETTPTDDNRSYHISSGKIKEELGFEPTHTIEDAIQDLKLAFDSGKILNSMTEKRYYNIKTMQDIDLR